MWSGFKVFRNYVDSKLHFLKKYKKNLWYANIFFLKIQIGFTKILGFIRRISKTQIASAKL